MDQVRAILRIIWQQRFWVLSGLGVIVAVVCWKMAASAVDAKFTANKGTIEGKFGEVEKIAKMQVHGNPEVNDQEFKQTSVIRDKVLALWQTMYENQREKVLKWPAGLGDEFLAYVENMKFRDPISSNNMREIYRNYAKVAFPELVEVVKARKLPAGALMGAGGGGFDGGGRGGRGGEGYSMAIDPAAEIGPDGLPIIQKYLVQWHDQGMLRAQLDFPAMPTSLHIWVTQEDLWVYRTLLQAIADTNEVRGATRPDNTAISDILALNVGRTAAMAFRERGILMMPQGAAPVAGGEVDPRGGGMDGGGAGMEYSRGGGFDGGGVGPDGAAIDPDTGLLAYRYIGDDGQPITDEASAVNPSAQFRRLPVRMILRMEQQSIPELLIECANATLPIEVKRVRINSAKSESGAGMTGALAGGAPGGMDGGGRGGEYGGRGGYGGGFDGGGGRGGEYSMTTMPVDPSATPRPELVDVEIHGIVYIYNPPDASTLTVPGGPENVAAFDAAEAPVAR